jgi:hypothetical protein
MIVMRMIAPIVIPKVAFPGSSKPAGWLTSDAAVLWVKDIAAANANHKVMMMAKTST